ncbi:MAG: CoA pyrophosphatase [Pseudomonadota bacterium]
MADRRHELAQAVWGDEVQNPKMAAYYRHLTYRDAAVLIPVIDRPTGATVLFTYRAAHLKAHAGQISFPGGKVDQDDDSAEGTALREFHEEVGIEPGQVRVIGKCPNYETGSGYRIQPFIGIVPPDLPIRLNPGEVESTFEVPLSHLLAPTSTQLTTKENLVRGHTVNIYTIAWQQHTIWGITAGIVASLRHTLLSGTTESTASDA